jgi:hypothetical protein
MADLRQGLIERRFIEVDPELAKHYLSFNDYPAQRNIKKEHLQELIEKMADGRFRFGEIAFAYIPANKQKDIMMNGQHVCHAIIESGITVPCVMEKFKLKNEREMSELFRQFEIQARSLKDMIKAEAHALDVKWPIDFIGLIVAAARLDRRVDKKHGRLFAGGTNTKENSVRLLSEYLTEAAWVASIMTNRSQETKHLFRAAVVYVMFMTFRKNYEHSLSFWSRVRDGENLTKEMPEMKLREFLTQSFTYVASNRYAFRKAENHEFIYRSVLAWNSFRTGKPTNLAYRADAPMPSVK